MKQYPKKIKFKKNHKIKKSFFILKSQKIFFPLKNTFFLKAEDSGKLKFNQIESCRRSVRRNLKKKGNLLMRPFTYHSVTKKAVGLRMGSGKGKHSTWICPIRKGQVICEVSGVSTAVMWNALEKAKWKLPFKSKVNKIKY